MKQDRLIRQIDFLQNIRKYAFIFLFLATVILLSFYAFENDFFIFLGFSFLIMSIVFGLVSLARLLPLLKHPLLWKRAATGIFMVLFLFCLALFYIVSGYQIFLHILAKTD